MVSAWASATPVSAQARSASASEWSSRSELRARIVEVDVAVAVLVCRAGFVVQHMLFNSLQFALFFPVVTLLYFALPHRWRGTMLLLASCVFYMAFVPAYIGILAVTILIDYVAGIRIEATTGRARRLWLDPQHRVHLRGAVRLQVLRLLQRHDRARGARDGNVVRRSRAAAAAPDRALVPHVPEPELRDRGLRGTAGGGARLRACTRCT